MHAPGNLSGGKRSLEMPHQISMAMLTMKMSVELDIHIWNIREAYKWNLSTLVDPFHTQTVAHWLS